MVRRVFNALAVIILALSAVVAAVFIARDLLSFVSAGAPSLPTASIVGHNMAEGHIAFSQGGRIATATGDGGSPTFITKGPIDTTPVWSPDGAHIAFVALNPPDRVGVFVAKADGTGEHQVAPAASLYSRPTWSPDGKRLAFRDSLKARQGIYTVKVDGTELRRIYEGNPNTPAWSPDGRKIAFAFNKTPTTGGVYLIDLDGSNPQLLAEGRFGELAWSPDAKSLAVRSLPKNGDEEVLLLEVADARTRLLAKGAASGNWAPAWSPDGGMLALVLSDGDRKKLTVVPRELGGIPRDLVTSLGFSTPAWSSDGASVMVSAELRQGQEPALIRLKVDGSGKQRTLALGEFPSWIK